MPVRVQHKVRILNHHRTDASNGPTGALNLVIKKVKRAGHRFRRFDHYRLRCLLHAGASPGPTGPHYPASGPVIPTQMRRANNPSDGVFGSYYVYVLVDPTMSPCST